MNFMLSQIVATSASALGLVFAIAFIGAVLLALARSLGSALDFSVGLAFGTGLFALNLTSWHVFQFATPLRYGFLGLLIATLGVTLIAAASPAGRRIVARLYLELRPSWPVAVILLFHTFAMSALVLYPLGSGDLPLVTIGNNDIHVYVRLADYLLNDAASAGNIFQNDLRVVARSDVFGAYALLAFAAFLRDTDPVLVAQVPLVAVTALTGTFAACICRQVWQLPWGLSAIIGAAMFTNGLFAYTALHYFLSQLACASLLLIFTCCFLESARSGKTDFANFVVGQTALLGCVLFVFPVLLLPIIVATAMLAFWLMLIRAARERPDFTGLDAAVPAVRVALGSGLVAAGLVYLAAPARVASTIGKLAFYSRKDVVGWPLDFIHPVAISGFPMHTVPALGPSTSLITQVAEFGAVLALVAWLMVLIVRSGPTRAETMLRLTPLLAFFGLLLAYLVVWQLYGTSYQQWKFASSFPLLFSFSVAGSLCHLFYRSRHRSRGYLALSLPAALLATIAVNWISIGKMLYPRVSHYARAIGDVAAIDGINGIGRIYVDFPEPAWGTRMLAANFVKRPQVAFLQPTYYDAVQANVIPTRTEPALRNVVPGCDGPDRIPLGGGFFLATGDHPPTLKPGTLVAFDRAVNSCFNVTGLSDFESAGTWSDGHSVELSFTCDCQDPDAGLSLILVAHAFIARGIAQQRMLVRLDQDPVGEWAVSDGADHPITIPLPPGNVQPKTVRLALSFPDATSPASLGLSADQRLLGFQFVSLTLARAGKPQR